MKNNKKLLLSLGATLLLLIVLVFVILWQMDAFKTISSYSSYAVRYEFEEMIERAQLVVRGKVTGKSDTITISPATGSGDDCLYTDYYLEISDTLRGNKSAGDTVAVRIRGGETLTHVVYDENVPTINIGDEVVAFLYQLNMGATYTTEGDYYYIVAIDQGWYLSDGTDDDGNTVFTGAQDVESLIWEEISVSVPAYDAEHPVDYDWYRKDAMARYQSRLESGEYTKEEYDELVANLDKYATIKD